MLRKDIVVERPEGTKNTIKHMKCVSSPQAKLIKNNVINNKPFSNNASNA